MDTWLVDGEGQLACSRRESRLTFQATRKVKTILVKARSKVEYLSREWLGDENLQLLKKALVEADLALPHLDQPPEKIALLSCYSQHIAQGLLLLMPLGQLSRDLRGFRLEYHLGI